MTDSEIDGPSVDGINDRALWHIAVNLPRYDPVDDEEIIAVFTRIRDALRRFMAYQNDATHATVGDVRASLRRLDRALTEMQAAWSAADARTKARLTETIGAQPFQDAELKPLTEAEAPADVWTRGAYRIVKFREGTERIAESVATLKGGFDQAEQDRKGPIPGLHELTASLAEIFTHYSGRQFSRSQNRDSATDFVNAAITTLPDGCRPGIGSVDHSMRHVIRQADLAGRE